jgi:putative transcriptional regulator
MTNHPNRSRRKDAPGSTPSPDEIRAAREAAGLSRPDAARLIHATGRTWEKWELGAQRMHPGLWALFQLRIGKTAA